VLAGTGATLAASASIVVASSSLWSGPNNALASRRPTLWVVIRNSTTNYALPAWALS
jgi:hypothetical protein